MANLTVDLTPTEAARFNELMQASYRKVYNMAYRLAGNRSDAEDLTQEAFYRAYRSYRDFEGDRPFENWIFRIVTRLFLDLLRNRRRRVRTVSYDNPLPNSSAGDEALYFDVADDKPNAEANLMHEALGEDLQRVLDSLTPEQRTLITLADIQNMPYADIAEILGKPVGTIRSRLHRTHKLIRARLESAAKKSAPLGSVGTALAF